MTSFFWGKHLLATTTIICLLLIIGVSPAYAKEVGIRLTPSIIQIYPQEDGVIEKSITIENSGQDSLNIDIRMKAFTTNKKGEIIYSSEEKIDQATKDLIENDIQVQENNIAVSSLNLAPGQKETVTLKINIIDIQNISQYTLSIFFLSKNMPEEKNSPTEESPIHTELNFSIGSALHILIFGKKEESSQSINISSFQTENFLQHGPVHFIVKAKNTSEKYINIHGNIAITNMFGQQIGIVRIPTQLLPAGAEKELSGQVAQTAETIVWPERILLGGYKASVTIITDAGNQTHSEAEFFAFPIKTVILTLIALLIASFIIGQVREKIK